MQKKTKSRLRLPDVLVLAFGSALLAYFGYLFWKDLHSVTVRTDKDSIATIYFKQKIAQRKFNDRVVWERLSQNAALYNEDTIRTADFSQATIRFNDGTLLDVYENTMLQIYYEADAGVQISVDGGDIQVEAAAGAKQVAVRLDDGSVVQMDAGSSLAAKTDSQSGVHTVEVKTGSARVTTESGATAALALGDSVNIENGTDIQRNVVTVLSPARDITLLNIDGAPLSVHFDWKLTGDAEDAVVVQTARTKDFSAPETSQTLRGVSAWDMRVSEGIQYWRVFSAENGSETAVSGKITVENVAPVTAVSPLNFSAVHYRTGFPRIAFRWTGNEFAAQYRLVVSTTPDMRSVVASIDTEDTFATIDSLGEGYYYWQVTPYYALNGIGYGGESDIRSFSVQQDAEIPPPDLAVPADNAVLTYRETPSAVFVWKSEIPATSYEIVIARDADCTDVVFTTETTSLRLFRDFGGDGLSDGTYYWKIIRHADESDDTTPESAVRSFTLTRFIPQQNRLLYPPERFGVEQQKLGAVQFMWRLSDDYAGETAVLQIAPDRDFSTVQFERAYQASSAENLLLPVGSYWWRVAVKTDDGITGETEPRELMVLKALDAPAILTPEAQSELLVASGAPVVLSWEAVEGADYYNVRVFSEKNVLVTQEPRAQDTTALFALSAGSYTAQVQAVAAETETTALRLSDVSSRAFSVREPFPVTLRSPSGKAKIAGLTALRRPTVFTWQDGKDKADSYTFVLLRRQADGSYREVEHIQSKKNTVSLARLTEGAYRWHVQASTADGIPLDSGEREFIIESVPELAKPVLVTPEANFVIGSSYLRANRIISFEWKAVSHATEYRFALYKKDEKGARTAVYTQKNIKGRQVQLSDLSILDVGTFEWTVTAYAYAKDGFEEQHSKAASGTFSIDIRIPRQVETKKTGKMYGE